MQLVDQDKNFKIQKLTEDSIQLQSDIHVLSKEKERLMYERDEQERKVRQIEPFMDEVKKLQNEKAQFLDQVRKLEGQVEMFSHDR